MEQWTIFFQPAFKAEFDALDPVVQDELLARLHMLKRFGPALGRPSVDTLNGSAYTNMKELRFDAADGVWRVAFAFDPKRQAVLLVAGNKKSANQKQFYKRLIRQADDRYANHLKEDSA